MDPDVVAYRGLGATVVLDITSSTLTITHELPSEHLGVWVIPLDEIIDVHFRERTSEAQGWAQVRTITSPEQLPNPSSDPYAFRSGSEQMKTFCYLVMFVATLDRIAVEGRTTRDVIMDEVMNVRRILNRLRGD